MLGAQGLLQYILPSHRVRQLEGSFQSLMILVSISYQ